MSEHRPPPRLSRDEIEAVLNKEGMSLSTLKKPESWDIKAAEKLMDRLIDENREWLKEMAKR